MRVFAKRNYNNCAANYKQFSVSLVFGLLVCAVCPVLAQEPEVALDFDVTDALTDGAADRSRKPWRVHLSYLQSWSLPGAHDTVAQHMDAKLQVEKLLNKNLYAVLDTTLLLRGPDDSETAAEDSYAVDSRIQSLYLQGSMDQFSMKAGFQTAVWGKMDMLGITDRLSPWDYSQFVYTAPQDARVAQGMISAAHFINSATEAEFVYNAAPEVNKYPGGSARYLLQQQLGHSNFTLQESKPQAWSDYELALRLKLSKGDFDGTFTMARLLQNDPLIEADSATQFRASYPPYYLLAYSYNFAGDGVLWKLAVAYSANRWFANGGSTEKADVMQWGGGVDLNFGDEFMLSVEAAYTYLDSSDALNLQRNGTQLATRLSKSFLHKNLDTVYYFQYYKENHMQTHSASLSYHFTDDWSAEMVHTLFKVNDDTSPTKFMDRWDSFSVKTTVSW